ncbi:MAG: zinc-ribbon domain-containing protein [Chloroflexota bacterium]|nr:zinc-ribbon domain-containing protein [Chloroflexota bacterium]
MTQTDKSIKCCDCGERFVYTASEQQHYAGKGFQYEPRRCPECRSTYFDRRREDGHRPGWVHRS